MKPVLRPWRAAVLGAGCGAVVALAVFAPARWLAAVVESVTHGRLVMAEATGTVWRGSAALTLTGGPGSRDAWTLPGRLGWSLGLQGLALRVALTQDCCLPGPLVWRLTAGLAGPVLTLAPPFAPAAVAAGAAAGGLGPAAGARGVPRAALPDEAPALAQWPAAWLAALGTPWNTLQPAGLVRVSSPGLRIAVTQGRWQIDGALRADFVGMSSRLSTLPVLGSYRAELTAAGGGVAPAAPTLDIRTLEGPLLLSGQGQWAGDRWRLRGEARAAADSQAALQNLLNLIGRRDGERAILSIG